MSEIKDVRYGRITVKRHSKAKYVRLSVAPSGVLSISAPLYTPLYFIKRFISTSGKEIEDLLAHHRVVYSENSQIGKSHHLEVSIGNDLKITYKKPKITVQIIDYQDLYTYETQQLIKPFVVKALRIEALAYLPRRVQYLAEKYDFNYNKIKLSHAKSRWGSCSSDKTISLNIALMKIEFELIDYIIIHELAHTVILNHSKNFWQHVEVCDPEFKQHRKALKQLSPHI